MRNQIRAAAIVIGAFVALLFLTAAVAPINPYKKNPLTTNDFTLSTAFSLSGGILDVTGGGGGSFNGTNLTANVLNLSECNLGTIAGGGTLTPNINTNLYRATLSGSTFIVNLPTPSNLTNGFFFCIAWTNSSGGIQIGSIQVATVATSLVREDLVLNGVPSLVSTVTNGITGAGTLTFRTVAGLWARVESLGDILNAANESGWFKSGNTNAVSSGDVSANTGNFTNGVSGAQFTGTGPFVGFVDIKTLNPTNKARITIPSQGFVVSQTNELPLVSGIFVMETNTTTLANKRMKKRVTAAADATSITINVDNSDFVYQVNTQGAGTLTINNPTGTPNLGDVIWVAIKCSNVQTLSWGSEVRPSVDLPRPTTTSSPAGVWDYFVLIRNPVDSKWDFMSKNFGF